MVKFIKNRSNLIIEISTSPYILIFVYAALSKLLDFEKFRLEIGKSPLLTEYATVIAWGVPSIEILISFLLLFKKTKKFAMFMALSLMVSFTAYLLLVLHFIDYIPCSCGGILEKLGWNEHLVFNMTFIFLAIISIYMNNQFTDNNKNSKNLFAQ